MDKPCRGECLDCVATAKRTGHRRCTFRCTTCKETVGWCDGGIDDIDPNGTLCARCWQKRKRRRDRTVA